MKYVFQFVISLLVLFGLQYVQASDASSSGLSSDIQEELRLAEADMEEDEDLFMDEGADDGEDWTEEESEEVAEESSPAPALEPPPEPLVEPEAQEHVEKIADAKPTPKPVAAAPAAKSNARVPASFKQGFKVSNSACVLHKEPDSDSSVILTSKDGKRLWLEAVDASWYKGFYRKGYGYFPASCFD